MKMRKKVLLFALFAFAASVAFKMAAAPNNIALFWVIKNSVEVKKQDKDWTKAKKGDFIYGGDYVRTQQESFTLIKFNDASTLRLGSNAEVQVYGEKNPQSTAVNGGDVGFTMTKRTTGQFEFTTPTSVASIRGTGGILSVQVDGTDFLTIVEGLVHLANKISNKGIDVSAGQTGESSKNGDMSIHQSTQDELNKLTQLDNQFNQQQHKLEMWFRGSDGKLHEIIIETER
ncbi:MAG TPA: FecR family protein [Candidatus Kryptonia bacterium]